MKPIKLCAFLFILLLSTSLKATSSLYFSDPRQWGGVPGHISQASLTITPKGVFWLFSLEMTYSAKNTYMNKVTDTLEVVHHFSLPKEAIVTDSWLWVDTTPVQAFIVEKNLAQTVYEGIVKRRKDPSILTKTSETQYEFRVFPMPGSVPRKVKLLFLMPATITKSYSQVTIPTNIFSSAANAIVPRLIVNTDSSFHTPTLWQSSQLGLIFSPIANSAFNTYIPNSYITSNSPLSLRLTSPLKNGLFLGTQATSDSTGFYQLAAIPGEILNTAPIPKKVAFLIDHESGKSTFTPAQVIQIIRNHVLTTFAPTDSFNIFAGKLNVIAASSGWIPADSASVNAAFNSIYNVSLPYSNLPALLSAAINFIQANGNKGNIHLSSASDDFINTAASTALRSDILASMNPKLPIDIFSFSNKNLVFNLYGNQYYEGNELLYSNLAQQTGGNFYNLRYEDPAYSSNSYTLALAPQLTSSFENLDGIFTAFEVSLLPDSGTAYARYDLEGTSNTGLNKISVQVGKYYGRGAFSTSAIASYNGSILTNNQVIQNNYITDTSTRLMWTGSYQRALEYTASNNSLNRQSLISSSLSNRILCTYTAFLALEPGMDSLLCPDCVEEEPELPVVGISETKDISLVEAVPNPFSENITISISGINMEEGASIEIKDIQGRLISVFDNSNTANMNSVVWNGTDQNGSVVAKGLYLATIKSGSIQRVIKIIKL